MYFACSFFLDQFSFMRKFWPLFLQIVKVCYFSSLLNFGAAAEFAPSLALGQHSFNRNQVHTIMISGRVKQISKRNLLLPLALSLPSYYTFYSHPVSWQILLLSLDPLKRGRQQCTYFNVHKGGLGSTKNNLNII